MPQQSDDLQIKWQKCLHETFFACDVVYRYAPHVLEKIEEVVNLIITYAKRWCESLQEVARRFMEVIRPAFQKLSEAFNDLKDTCKDLEKPVEKKSYPHSYPHNVHKYNTRGYPRPIYRCARSRC